MRRHQVTATVVVLLAARARAFQTRLPPFPSHLVARRPLSHTASFDRAPRATSRLLSDTLYETSTRVITKLQPSLPRVNFPSFNVAITKSVDLLLSLDGTADALKSILASCWWCLPLVLCLVPLYTTQVLQIPAATPDWWKMVNMDYIRQSRDATMVIGAFLFSNIAYFGSGAYLIKRFPPLKLSSGGQRFSALSSLPTPYTWLGVWVLLAGAVSTVFHSVQALGDPVLAEALCYLDHGVAISTVAYFWHICGRPSKNVVICGVTGLVALALPLRPGYAFLHSTWHFLSAITGVLWAQQRKAMRRAQLVMVRHQAAYEQKAK